MTIRLELKTVALREDGCYSVALWDGRPFAVTLERTFEDGWPIIGNGDYHCARSIYRRGGYETFEIGVPGHTLVKFHKGNWETDSEGCVLVAESFAVLNNLTAIADSAHGFAELMALAQGLDEFDMEVTGR